MEKWEGMGTARALGRKGPFQVACRVGSQIKTCQTGCNILAELKKQTNKKQTQFEGKDQLCEVRAVRQAEARPNWLRMVLGLCT